jgi:hypothetical protein
LRYSKCDENEDYIDDDEILEQPLFDFNNGGCPSSQIVNSVIHNEDESGDEASCDESQRIEENEGTQKSRISNYSENQDCEV